MVKIAICGKMASGKTTLANHLVDNYDFHKYSLAGPVKDFARFLFDIPTELKDRILFQKVGDGARNHLYDEVWLDTMLSQVEQYEADFGPVDFVVDDVRYLNEVYYLASRGWKIIKLEIDEDLQIKRLKREYPIDWKTHVGARHHPSEMEIDKVGENWADLTLDAQDGKEIINSFKNFVNDNA